MKKKWVKYTIYILFMICFTFVGNISLGAIPKYISRTYSIPIFWILATDILVYIGFGVLIGLDSFMTERTKEGKWRINISKLVIIGIPSLIFAFFSYLVFGLSIPMGRFASLLINGKGTYMNLFRVLLGYTIATSFYKESAMKSIEQD